MIKIWTVNQMPIIQKLVLESKIPEPVSRAILREISILDEYYSSERKVDTDDGGYCVVFTDYQKDWKEIRKFLTKYHVSVDDAEFENILYIDDGIIWKEVLYIITNDFAISIFFPIKKDEKK